MGSIFIGCEEEEEAETVADLFDREIIGIEPGAGIMGATEEALETYDSLAEYELIDSSDAAMSASLIDAADDEEWIVVTGWTPHWKFGTVDLKFLEDPEDCYGEAETINALVREGFEDDHPDVAEFLDEFLIDDPELSEIMLNIDETGDDIEAVEMWAEDNPDKIDEWALDVDGEGEEIELAYMDWICARGKTYLVAHILENEMNYEVSTIQADAGGVYTDVAAGDTDAFVASWQPVTHETYIEDYGDELVDLGPVYEGAKIGLVVPEYVDIDSIDEMDQDL